MYHCDMHMSKWFFEMNSCARTFMFAVINYLMLIYQIEYINTMYTRTANACYSKLTRVYTWFNGNQSIALFFVIFQEFMCNAWIMRIMYSYMNMHMHSYCLNFRCFVQIYISYSLITLSFVRPFLFAYYLIIISLTRSTTKIEVSRQCWLQGR